VISVDSPGSDGGVITEGSRGNRDAPGDGLLVVVVGVPEFSVDAVGASVAGVVEVFEVIVGAMVVAGSCWGARLRVARCPHPTNAIGLRQPGIGSSDSGSRPPSPTWGVVVMRDRVTGAVMSRVAPCPERRRYRRVHAHTAATNVATDRPSKLHPAETRSRPSSRPVMGGQAAA
jgi:hypothetical protein